MFRIPLTRIALVLAIALPASQAHGQLFRKSRNAKTQGAPGATSASPSTGTSAASRGPRQLMRTGLDYLTVYGDPGRALAYLRQAKERQKELTQTERNELDRAIRQAELQTQGTEIAEAPIARRAPAPMVTAHAPRREARPIESQPTAAPIPKMLLGSAGAPENGEPDVAVDGAKTDRELQTAAAKDEATALTESATRSEAADPAPAAMSEPELTAPLTQNPEPHDQPNAHAAEPSHDARPGQPIGLQVLSGPDDDVETQSDEPSSPAPAEPAPPADGMNVEPAPVRASGETVKPEPASSDEVSAQPKTEPARVVLTPAPAPPRDTGILLIPPPARRPRQSLSRRGTQLPELPKAAADATTIGAEVPASAEVLPALPDQSEKPEPSPEAEGPVVDIMPPLPAIDAQSGGEEPASVLSDPPAVEPLRQAPPVSAPSELPPAPEALPQPSEPADEPAPILATPVIRRGLEPADEPAPGAETPEILRGLEPADEPPPVPATPEVFSDAEQSVEAEPLPVATGTPVESVPDVPPEASAVEPPRRERRGELKLHPDTLREVEELARRQAEEERQLASPDRAQEDMPPATSDYQSEELAEIPRAPSPTEARPIKPIPVPDDFVPLEQRMFPAYRKYWASPATCHMPLYFQDAVLERYGQSAEQALGPHMGRHLSYPLDDPRQSAQRNQILQPAYSTGMFLLQIAAWPFNILMDPPWEAQYDLGYHRPGDPIPPDSVYWPKLGIGPPLHGMKY